MTSDFGEQLATQLIRTGKASRSELIRCSGQEIQELEEACGMRVPEIYRSFLLRMGRGAGAFLSRDYFYYPSLLRLRADADELLTRDGAGFTLPADAFVFSMLSEGYQFLYFRVSEGDDPPVYRYVEGKGQAQRWYGALSGFFLACAAEPLECAENCAFWPRWRLRFRQLLCRVLGSRYAKLGNFFPDMSRDGEAASFGDVEREKTEDEGENEEGGLGSTNE